MLNLALDTCTRWGRFALAEDDRLLAYRPLNVSGSYADALLPVVQDMLAGASRTLTDIAGIGVTVGPGSFTGVRIGVATAKSLAWALGCRLQPVSSLAAMAAALLAEHPAAIWAVPALDARRGEIFAGVFAREGTWVRPVVAPAAGTPDDWWSRVTASVPDPDTPVYGGDGVHLLLGQGSDLRPELLARGEPALRRWSAAHPATARQLALAMGSGALAAVHPFAVVPDYLRASDAEVKRDLDLTPRKPDGDISSHRSGGKAR